MAAARDAAQAHEAALRPGRRRSGVAVALGLAVAGAVVVARSSSSPTFEGTSLSRKLYSCENGNPGVAEEYAEGWGTIDGVWYGIASNDDGSVVGCLHSEYEIRHKRDRVTEMTLFDYDDDVYGWNSTLVELARGKWERSEYEGKRPSWMVVYDVGVYDGERWWGCYFCGDVCAATRHGWAVVYKEGAEASDAFLRVARKSMRDHGLLEDGTFKAINQTACEYTWW